MGSYAGNVVKEGRSSEEEKEQEGGGAGVSRGRGRRRMEDLRTTPSVWVGDGVGMVRGSLGTNTGPRFRGGDLESYFGSVAFEIYLGL